MTDSELAAIRDRVWWEDDTPEDTVALLAEVDRLRHEVVDLGAKVIRLRHLVIALGGREEQWEPRPPEGARQSSENPFV